MRTMTAPPTSTKTSLQQRLSTRARQRWPQLAGVDVRFRGAFAYVTAHIPDGDTLPLMRLRYGGFAARWGFAVYLASNDGYEVRVLPTGDLTGSPKMPSIPPAASTLATRPPGHDPRRTYGRTTKAWPGLAACHTSAPNPKDVFVALGLAIEDADPKAGKTGGIADHRRLAIGDLAPKPIHFDGVVKGIWDDVVHADDPAGADERGVQLVVSADASVGVVRIDKQEIDQTIAEDLTALPDRIRLVRVGAEEMHGLVPGGERSEDGGFPHWVAAPAYTAREVDADEDGIGAGHLRENKSAPALCRP